MKYSRHFLYHNFLTSELCLLISATQLFELLSESHSSSKTVSSLGKAVWFTMATIATDMLVRIM